jgi:hypothetical protein
MGWGAPGNGRPTAPRRAGRGAPLPGGAPAWRGGGGAGKVVETSCHSYGAQDAANCARGRGGARERQDAGVPRPGTAGRCVAFIGGHDSGSTASGALRCGPAASECACKPWQARLAGGAHDGPPGNAQLVVRRGKDGSRSKDGRREGDHGPDLEAVGNEPHACRGGRDCRSMARGADLASRVPSAPAALWSAAALVFSRSTRL